MSSTKRIWKTLPHSTHNEVRDSEKTPQKVESRLQEPTTKLLGDGREKKLRELHPPRHSPSFLVSFL